MKPRIVVVTQSMVDEAVIQEMAPDGFDLRIARPGGVDWKEAMGQAEYLVGFVDMLVKDELYAIAPKLKLIQVLSAGYDRADIAAARRGGVPFANNGGANSTAVSEHAVLLMLAVAVGIS